MPLIRKSRAIPKKVIRLPKSAGISRKRVMAIYRRHVSKLRATKAPIRITQRRQVIGTDNTWFNAQTIERNPAWIAVNNASYVWSSRDLTNQAAVISTRFRIENERTIRRARLFLSVDNYAVVLINGRIVLYDAPQNTPEFFTQGRTFDIRPFLRRVGINDIVIVAFNFGGPRSSQNPAGVAARLNIRLAR
ncbi:hypothetical protein RAC89_29450 [Paenibacillus sp. GD4]|jgi:hypothetical protein|uniref:hypothetical protein n=1 Tax=Paenibacillus sp. GD4 TaxID=3068890 RepID=UPI0027964945|nr:hypothetical protein [Paenibacillus sp. GD4]MDQ1914508.1 hypothetical protein [Paenibacillus sp. GD4]